MLKNSFTLFELLISIILLSITLSVLIKIEFTSNTNLQNYNTLLQLENKFITTGKINSKNNIKFKQIYPK